MFLAIQPHISLTWYIAIFVAAGIHIRGSFIAGYLNIIILLGKADCDVMQKMFMVEKLSHLHMQLAYSSTRLILLVI